VNAESWVEPSARGRLSLKSGPTWGRAALFVTARVCVRAVVVDGGLLGDILKHLCLWGGRRGAVQIRWPEDHIDIFIRHAWGFFFAPAGVHGSLPLCVLPVDDEAAQAARPKMAFRNLSSLSFIYSQENIRSLEDPSRLLDGHGHHGSGARGGRRTFNSKMNSNSNNKKRRRAFAS